MTKTDDLFSDLPGGTLFREGLSDLQNGRQTVPACLIEIARGRFVQFELLPERDSAPPLLDPELRLYRLLRAEGGDAYSHYNSLLRELASFQGAFERRRRLLTSDS